MTSNKIEDAIERIWCGALDAKGMEHEFPAVEDYERAYIKYKKNVKAEAIKSLNKTYLKLFLDLIGEDAHRKIDPDNDDWGNRECLTCGWIAEYEGDKVPCNCTTDNKLKRRLRAALNQRLGEDKDV